MEAKFYLNPPTKLLGPLCSALNGSFPALAYIIIMKLGWNLNPMACCINRQIEFLHTYTVFFVASNTTTFCDSRADYVYSVIAFML